MPIAKLSPRAKARKKYINGDSAGAWSRSRQWEINKRRKAVAASERIEKRRTRHQNQIERERRAVKGLLG